MRMMRVLLAAIVVLALGAAAVHAGCGVKDTHQGTLKSFDADKKVMVVTVEDGEEVRITLTASTQVKDGEGNAAKPSDLVGKKVKVVSEHAKADSVEEVG